MLIESILHPSAALRRECGLPSDVPNRSCMAALAGPPNGRWPSLFGAASGLPGPASGPSLGS
eukprot:9810104-Alexandrium_andersonii.AAC.1